MIVLLFTYQKMLLALLFITLLPCLHIILLLIMDFIVTIIFGQQGAQ
jgi:hypothetical protein